MRKNLDIGLDDMTCVPQANRRDRIVLAIANPILRRLLSYEYRLRFAIVLARGLRSLDDAKANTPHREGA